MRLLRQHFFAGLLVVIPLGVIAWILAGFGGFLWGIPDLLPDPWQPRNFLANQDLAKLLNTGFVLVLSVGIAFGISFLGWTSKRFLGQQILRFISEQIIQRIPVVRGIYGALDQLLRTLAEGKGQQFSRVVYVEYPRRGTWSIAFVTGPAPKPHDGIEEQMLNIFIPTTPNPTSGFHLIVPESDVRDAHLKVEDAFKTLLSLGIAHPQNAHKGSKENLTWQKAKN